jgi:2-methylcitrate dehydratase PrpD
MSGAVPAIDPARRSNVEVTANLGRWVAELDLSRIPVEVVALIKGCVLDSLGCGIYGAAQPWGRIASDTVIGFSGGGRASLFGRAEKVSVPDAALANGTAIHGFEIDDLHLAGMCHPGAVTVPASLAAAEAESISNSGAAARSVRFQSLKSNKNSDCSRQTISSRTRSTGLSGSLKIWSSSPI